eukprot:TRINITY_DN31674_c0_g1_i1.p1 TRINITY_DN31674_c0_g1~~TRINITY_DN31674_c0_g1_i1.p1  ORF type:complete len:570 (-),score=60.40 TRINITY_DN31674_c0_g1_i1:213-1922(-)
MEDGIPDRVSFDAQASHQKQAVEDEAIPVLNAEEEAPAEFVAGRRSRRPSMSSLSSALGSLSSALQPVQSEQSLSSWRRPSNASRRPSITSSSVDSSRTASDATRMSRKMRKSMDRSSRIRTLKQSASAASLESKADTFVCGFDKSVVQSRLDWIVSIVILINISIMGISADVSRFWKGWIVVDILFAIVYSIELILKLSISGIRSFYFGQDWAWNVFDTCVLVLAILDIISTSGSSVINFTFLRLARIFRLTRLVRLFRAPFFKEILMMINGMVGSARTLFWSLVLVSLPFYAIALLLRETIGHYERTHYPELVDLFSTVSSSWFTVFRCVMGDCNDVRGRPIIVQVTEHFGWIYGIGYSLLITLSFFGLFNIIAAVYVENLLDAAKSNEVLMQRRRLNDEKQTASSMSKLLEAVVVAYFTALNADCEQLGQINLDLVTDIEISEDVFKTIIQNPTVVECLDRLDIALDDRLGLFEILDADCSNTLTLDEIISGLMRLRGQARRSDIVACTLLLRNLQHEFKDFSNDFEEISEELQRQGGAIAQLKKVLLQPMQANSMGSTRRLDFSL